MLAKLTGLIALVSLSFNGTEFVDNSASLLPAKDIKSNSMDVETADLDQDGDLDIVIASEFRPNLIYLNDGKGKFTDVSRDRIASKNYDSEDIAVADFDGDKDLDLFFASEDTYVHEFYLNDGKGFFTDAESRIPVKSKANAVLSNDFDKDGDVDMILGNEGQEIFLENDGKGNFTDATASRLPKDNSVTQDIESADIDRDGDIDLVLGNEDGNKLYLNNGKGIFTDAMESILFSSSEETRKVDLADIDGDGDTDIFFSNVNFTNTKSPENRLLTNDGKGHFTDVTTKQFSGNNNMHTADACFTDLDGDRDLDMIVANVFGGYQQVFVNNGKGYFNEQTSAFFKSNPSVQAIGVEAADLNKDGVVDLYFSCFRSLDVLMTGKR